MTVPAGDVGGDSGSAGSGHSKNRSNSPSLGASSKAGTAVEESGSRGNHVEGGKEGSQSASPGQGGSEKGQPAAATQGSPAGNGPGANGIAKSGCDLSGGEAVRKEADNGYVNAAQETEKGFAQNGTAKVDTGNKKHKGKKKKKKSK